MDPINILVVDDEKEIAELVEIYLVSDGYHVSKAKNAQEGLDILSREDMILKSLMAINSWSVWSQFPVVCTDPAAKWRSCLSRKKRVQSNQ